PQPAPSRKATQPCGPETTGNVGRSLHVSLKPARTPKASSSTSTLPFLLGFHHHITQTHSPAPSSARTHLRPQAPRPPRQSQPPPTALKTLTSSTPTKNGSSSSREMAM
ncbi:unnamed protein product, partial [Ixodes persulcatus]